MDFYSTALLLALISSIMGGLLLIASRMRKGLAILLRSSLITAALGLMLALISMLYHYAEDHSKGMSNHLSLNEFISLHPAPLVISLAGVVILGLGVYGSGRTRIFGRPDKRNS